MKVGLPFIGEIFAGGEPYVFRHLVSYPDITSYTEGLVRRAKPQAMTATRDYNGLLYAQCDEPSVRIGLVQHRPTTAS